MEIVEGQTTIEDVEAFVADVGEIADKHGVTIQAFDARYVADRSHLRRAVDLATRAIERGEEIADDRGVEVLLYAAGRRQISRALEMGVSAGECPVVAVVVDCEAHEWAGDPVGEQGRPTTASETTSADEIGGLIGQREVLTEMPDDRETLRSYFEITDSELDATDGTVADLVRERVALLVVER